jgi:hypothetical protein
MIVAENVPVGKRSNVLLSMSAEMTAFDGTFTHVPDTALLSRAYYNYNYNFLLALLLP